MDAEKEHVLKNFLCIGIISLLTMAVSPVQAISIDDSVDMGNGVFDISSNGELDFDIIWNNLGPVWLDLRVDRDDLGSPVAFSSGQFNETGIDWTDFHIELRGGPTFAEVNAVSPSANTMLGGGDTMAWIFFDIPLVPDPNNGLEIGDTDSPIDPNVDWFINLNGLVEDAIFTMHLHPSVAVPEPGTLAMFGLALICLGIARRRKAAA